MKTPSLRALTFVAGFALAAGVGALLLGDSPARASGGGAGPTNPLSSCVYHRGLFDPVPDVGGIPGHYVAQLPCEEDRHIVAGSCYLQYVHLPTADFGIAGSHPYENGAHLDVPDDDEEHEAVDGENGWICRVNKEPYLEVNLGFYENNTAKLAVGALCCR